MTPLNLDPIRRREQAATPGPWTVEWDTDDVSDVPFPVSLGPIGYLEHHGANETADVEFIAHARQDVPALLTRVAELETQVAKLTSGLDDAEQYIDELTADDRTEPEYCTTCLNSNCAGC